MADEKVASTFNETLLYQDTDFHDDSTLMPPPYTDEPPAYSSLVENSHMIYADAPPSIDYMEKLPFEEHSPRSYYPEPSPVQVHVASTTQGTTQQPLLHPPSNTLRPSPQTTSTAPHKVLLQPTSSRLVETMAVSRRKTVSHVTDLETGKEYFVKERKSRSGLRSKAVIKELGGPRTYVKETPKKTVVCQKRK